MRDVLRKLRHLSTSIGRQHLWMGARNYAWPLLRAVAGLYRRTLARRIRLACVVGSYGKTTTAAAVATVLGTSPPPSDNAFSRLALWLSRQPPWQRYAVFEAGIDGPGQMAAYGTMLRPHVVVVTSIGSEHHRSLGTLDVTQAEKSRMVEALAASGTAILNADDPRVAAMAARCAGRVIRFGIDAEARATDVAIDWPYGTRVTLRIGQTERLVRLRLLGWVMVYPFLAAMSVALAEGLPLGQAITALEAMPPRRGRLQLEPLPGAAWLVRDDFKSSVETIDAALDVLSGIPGRRIVVIGSVSEPPGSQGPIYRRIGTRLAEVASRVVVVSSELQRYAAGVRAGGLVTLRAGRCPPRCERRLGSGARGPAAGRRRAGEGAGHRAPRPHRPRTSGPRRPVHDRFLLPARRSLRGLPQAGDGLDRVTRGRRCRQLAQGQALISA